MSALFLKNFSFLIFPHLKLFIPSSLPFCLVFCLNIYSKIGWEKHSMICQVLYFCCMSVNHKNHYKVSSPNPKIFMMAQTCHNCASARDKTSPTASRLCILSLSIFSLMPCGSRGSRGSSLASVFIQDPLVAAFLCSQ